MLKFGVFILIGYLRSRNLISNFKQNKMKKVFAIFAIAALAACGGASTEAKTDTAVKAVDTAKAVTVDTAVKAVDTAAKAK
jgi:hypothetical protein